MSDQPIIIERIYKAVPEKVWKAITDKDQMKEWYFDLDDFKAEVGFEFKFPGEGVTGEKYMHLCKVTEVIPYKKLQYSWRYEHYEGNSLVTFELFEEEGDQTRLKLTHAGVESFPQNNPDFSKENFPMGWKELLGNLLRKYLEAGSTSV